MQISNNGLALIRESEGFRSFVYIDAVGVRTIGYGHVIQPGEFFPSGITEAQAETLLRQDAGIASSAVGRLAPWANQNQHDALTDFTFQFGEGRLKELLAHGQAQITAQLPRWVHGNVNGKMTVLAGIVTRRQREIDLFNKPL